MKKICCTCKIEKDASEFHKSKALKDGHRRRCKECRKKCYQKNKEYRREMERQYYQKNKEQKIEYGKEYRRNNKDKISKYKKEYYQKIKEYRREYDKNYAKENKEKIKKRTRTYRKNNKEYLRKYWMDKYYSDTKFRLSIIISSAIRKSIKNKNNRHWENLVGYSLEKLIEHLEQISEFTIQDYLEKDLHIDHIIPKSLYNFENYKNKEFRKCWNFKNLRIIKAEENLNKNDKLDMNLVKFYNIKHLLPKGWGNVSSSNSNR